MSKKYLITSALPYASDIPHIGNFVGSLLPSDVYARFCRANNRDVLFVCGADAHGTPIMVAAKKAGVPVAGHAENMQKKLAHIMKEFDLSFDYFGTTHSEKQTELVQNLFTRLDSLGFIQERTSVQPYSVSDKMFLADRQIEGTCPKCGFDGARGDQCDKCGELLDPADLINPYAVDSGSRNIEMRETTGLYYSASKMKPAVKKWFEQSHGWSKKAIDDTKKYLSEDIPDGSITRDIPWGIPVNKPGYENKVFYVWFDAPWGYVSISQYARKDWADFWHGGNNVHYVQFMGKDNIKFHAIFFPGHEMALDQNWKCVDQLKAFSFLNFEGGKVSKSSGNGVFLNDAITDAPSDTWRYALMASAPETDDTDFTIQRFADIVNKDLNGMLGNFVSRVCKLTDKNFGNKVPERAKSKEQRANEEEINEKITELTAALDACEFRNAITALRSLWAIGNEFMTQQAPWTLVKNGDMDGAGAVLNECFQLIDLYARVSAPFIPNAAAKMRAIFGIENRELRIENKWPKSYERRIADGTEFIVPENLFARIDDDKVKEMTEKYTTKKVEIPKIVVAKILTVTPHQTREDLNILTVDAGDEKPLQIVCGAPNVRVGFTGVLAKIGAILPEMPKPISKRPVYGVESNGMMCSPAELGLSGGHDGILELPDGTKIGSEYKTK